MVSQGLPKTTPALPHMAWPQLFSETMKQDFLNPPILHLVCFQNSTTWLLLLPTSGRACLLMTMATSASMCWLCVIVIVSWLRETGNLFSFGLLSSDEFEPSQNGSSSGMPSGHPPHWPRTALFSLVVLISDNYSLFLITRLMLSHLEIFLYLTEDLITFKFRFTQVLGAQSE